MGNITNKTGTLQWLRLIFGAGLLISFFLPWVSWEGALVSGYSMPAGSFFTISEKAGGPDNPFPQVSFTFYLFWLIPVLAFITAAFVLLKKNTAPFSFIAGALSLSLVTVYILFTNTLIDLGIGKSVWSMLKIFAYIHALCAVGLITIASPVKNQLPKLLWLFIGPVLAYGGYKLGEKYVMKETFKTTEQVKADYTVNANHLIEEFLANNTAANRKYLDKTLVLNGNATAVDILDDSTSTIRFADSTGSYIIFSLEKNQFDKLKNIKPGDPVSLKGVCSGSIFSEILGTTSMSFKRAILNNK